MNSIEQALNDNRRNELHSIDSESNAYFWRFSVQVKVSKDKIKDALLI